MIMYNELRTSLDFSRSLVWVNDVLKGFYGCDTELSPETIEILGQYGVKQIVRLFRYWSNNQTTELRYVVRTIESTIDAILTSIYNS